jgi:hypothetical protein
MATYPPPELFKQWKHGELSLEQAIGQLLQHLVAQSQQLAELERRLRQFEQPPGKPPVSERQAKR